MLASYTMPRETLLFKSSFAAFGASHNALAGKGLEFLFFDFNGNFDPLEIGLLLILWAWIILAP